MQKRTEEFDKNNCLFEFEFEGGELLILSNPPKLMIASKTSNTVIVGTDKINILGKLVKVKIR